MWIRIISCIARLLGCLTLGACLAATPHHPGTGTQPNIPLPTLGGLQFWADVQWSHGWRIQENVLFRHHRLLDPDDVRRAWGSRAACHAALDRRAPVPEIREPVDHLVVLLHGLGRSRHSMMPLARSLEAAGLDTVSLAYPSTRADLEQHAQQLNGLLDNLAGVSRISFVTHSLGGIVVRKALAESAAWRARIELGRVVQLGPPNQGSQLARWFAPTPISWVLGPSLTTLACDTPSELPALPCELAIIAGGKSDQSGWNPLLAGDDDGVVRVEETWLEEASEHHSVRSMHTLLMRNERALDITVRFLTR
jgi:hypothetical protein